jgi:hypothetical protein
MRRLQEITTKECEQLKSFLKKGLTPRGKSRSGATINRHIYLLSAVCSRAIAEERFNFNPCIRIKDEPENPSGIENDYLGYRAVSSPTSMLPGAERGAAQRGT